MLVFYNISFSWLLPLGGFQYFFLVPCLLRDSENDLYAEERRIFLFSLRDINLTLGLLPPRKHVVWRDSVGVEGSGLGLKIIVRGYFASEFSLLRHTDEPQKGRNSCLWLQTRYVLSSFGVLLMSCRVKFHVVRSALQYSACRIIMSFPRPPQ